MNEYALFFRDASRQLEGFSPEQIDEVVAQFVTWTQALQARDALSAVRRLSMEAPKVLTTRPDGLAVEAPYAESHELINGFVIVKAADDAAALALAQECPVLAVGGSVELRRVDSFPQQD